MAPSEPQYPDWPDGLCVHELISSHASLFPDRLAIQEGPQSISFGELDRQAAFLAEFLLANSARCDRPIAVLLPLSILLVMAELAILKAGSAFLPIDPNYPAKRIKVVLSEAQTEVVLTSRALSSRVPIPGLFIVEIDRISPDNTFPLHFPNRISVDSASLAYVIFTSGSSGKPKGVMVEHRNLNHLVDNFRSSLKVSHTDRSSVTASPAFDASIAEIWPYLALGASVHIAPPDLKKDLNLLLEWLREERITISLLPTVIVEWVMERDIPELPDLRVLITGGDQLQKLPPVHLPFVFINAYGPTECTVISSWVTIEPEPGARRSPSIGQAISGAFIRILDEQLRIVPVGVPGELFIGGLGVARGYLNNTELTQSSFIADPFDPTGSRRLYRTGDRGCWRGDGNIGFLGRIDRQIQMGGFRIEPAEVEFVLKQQHSVHDAAVVPQPDDNGGSLVAFLSTASTDGNFLNAVRLRVIRTLPAFMHPSVYVVLKEFPLTQQGKVDYRRLPLPVRQVVSQAELPADGSSEQVVRSVWRSFLGIDKISNSMNFFEAGGNSLRMIQMLRALEKRFGARIRTGAFLAEPTISRCVDLLHGAGTTELPLCINLLNGEHVSDSEGKIPFFCAAGAGGGAYRLASLAGASALRRPFYALESQALPEELRRHFSIQATADYFLSAIREVQSSGPYILGGYSLGGLVAVAMARRLLEMGESVQQLILIDTYAEVTEPHFGERLRNFVHRLKSGSVMDSKAYLAAKVMWLLQGFRSQVFAPREATDINQVQDREIAAALHFMRHDLVACHVPLRVIASRYGSRIACRKPDRGWSRLALAGFEFREIPGDHYSITESPYVATLGLYLRQFIDSSEA